MYTSHLTPRPVPALVACAAGALLVGAAVPAAATHVDSVGYAAATTHPDRLRLVATSSEFDTADVGKPGDSIGDLTAWTDTLSAQGRRVGHTSVSCTRTSIELGEDLCVGSLALDGRGMITLQVVLSDTGDYPLEVAVTGGTGEFAGVGGTMTVRGVAGNPDQLRLSLHLSR